MADINREMTREEMEAEIRACKALLNESDHEIIQTLEGICDCTSATGIISFLKSITEDVREIIVKRRSYRQTIINLEAQLDSETATQDAEV